MDRSYGPDRRSYDKPGEIETSIDADPHSDHIPSFNQDDNVLDPKIDLFSDKPAMNKQPNQPIISKHPIYSKENDDALPTWLPYTLRWHCLSSLLIFTLMLEIMVVISHIISSRELGLVDDDGSRGIVVASKFVPTVLAVVYVFLLSILLNDVKRTEAFARLACPAGAPAKRSLTWTVDAWWDALVQGFPTRRRETSWALLCATIAFILGFFIVSPFSSSLFVTQGMVFVYEEPFKKLDISAKFPLQATPLATTYFRTVSNILQNVTTSAWVTDKYGILPVWPARMENVPLSPSFSDSMSTWSATTTAFDVELNCEQMNYEKSQVVPYVRYDTQLYTISVLLTASSGCALNITDSYDTFRGGGEIWDSSANVNINHNTTYVPIAPNRPALYKTNCSQDEFLIITTPWSNNMTPGNFTITGQVCNARYYTGDTDVTVAFDRGDSSVHVQINESQYKSSRSQIPLSTANINSFQDAFLSQNWSTHLQRPIENRGMYGPAILLSALYNYSPGQLIGDPLMLQNAARLKQRFFGELLRDKFDESAQQIPVDLIGRTTENRRRVIVASAVAVPLETTLAIQLVLLIVVFYKTRLYNRPLGLSTDPSPAMSIVKLIAREPTTLQSLKDLFDNTKEEIDTRLLGQSYQLAHGRVHLITESTSQRIGKKRKIACNPSKPQSFAFRLWILILLTVFLSTTLVTITYLYWYSEVYGLYQTAFVYAFDVSLGGVNLHDINPASVVTTFVAVSLGLWWGSLDAIMRRIQPYLTVSQGPATGEEGLLVSYISSYLLWASWRACKRRHWILLLVCTGAFLAEIFTIAMSSMWQRVPGSVLLTANVLQQLQLRNDSLPFAGEGSALVDLYSNMRTSWIYGAAIQTSLNGTEPAWSSNGWAFVPVDLATLPQTTIQNAGNQTASTRKAMNATVDTHGIRARLECSPFEHLNLEDSTNWLTKWDLTNATQWATDTNPDILKQGYELGLSTIGNNTNLYLDQVPSYKGNYTTFFASDRRILCCQNMTNGQIGSGSVGYWSPIVRNTTTNEYPNLATPWPTNFTVKWIHGLPVEGYHHNIALDPRVSAPLLWSEEPRMAALNCMPIIERAWASVTVGVENSYVIDYNLTSEPQLDPFAWSIELAPVIYIDTAGLGHAINTIGYGVLFVSGLLAAADFGSVGNVTSEYIIYTRASEDNIQQTYSIREPGLNVDLMTYSMLALANNDHEALLNLDTLRHTAQRTFSAMFQNFASKNVSFENGGYVFQSLNENPLIHVNGVTLENSTVPKPPVNTTINLHVSRPAELLQMSKPAAWICMIILGYLVIVSIVLTIASRRYTKMLIRKLDSIADIAVLVAGSEKLLKLARSKSLQELKNDHVTRAKLDWFTGADGMLRWGIELVNEDAEMEKAGISSETSSQRTSNISDISPSVDGTESGPAPHDTENVSRTAPSDPHNHGPARNEESPDINVERASLNSSIMSPEDHVPFTREEDRDSSTDISVDESLSPTYSSGNSTGELDSTSRNSI
ncbi:uncharacterized protein F4822DRAFT_251261 [Hypoxylon trugodes]|uniref:uncharacterized protein n=1 Tax=Hypoxylon trugodes TaxID=326681 RepID=UPI0021A0FEFB|nr:uncharacterized protein F4822DRAFT_251261 [Hypoxylon trugodes]KAI1388600.1 hypothetical protein F4822DRAFT_251261 [Hypoxylon trugodes]